MSTKMNSIFFTITVRSIANIWPRPANKIHEKLKENPSPRKSVFWKQKLPARGDIFGAQWSTSSLDVRDSIAILPRSCVKSWPRPATPESVADDPVDGEAVARYTIHQTHKFEEKHIFNEQIGIFNWNGQHNEQ